MVAGKGEVSVNNRYEDAFKGWCASLRELINDASGLAERQERRYRFAHMIGELLTSPNETCPEMTGPVLYGVSLPGTGLCYVGQTQEAERRLRDLPVGESHHLANTVPPELWERVIVVRWPDLLEQAPSADQQAAADLGPSVCGLALEHLLQRTTLPPLNGRQRRRNGEWRPRDHVRSRSRGAVHAPMLPGLWELTWQTWQHLGAVRAGAGDPPAITTRVGRVVFPSRVLEETAVG